MREWGWPEWTWAVITGLGLIVAAFKHGEKYDADYNFWRAVVLSAVGAVILHFGGFW